MAQGEVLSSAVLETVSRDLRVLHEVLETDALPPACLSSRESGSWSGSTVTGGIGEHLTDHSHL